jgi:toxin ParE1/3/4
LQIYIRSKAREDVLRQYLYYLEEKDASRAADRFVDAVQDAFDALCRMPHAGAPKLIDNPGLAGLRTWPVRGFPAIRVYYLYTKDVVRVVRVLHGKRDVYPLLKHNGADEDE